MPDKPLFSLSCPPPFTVFEAFKEQRAPYELSNGTIKFPLDRPVPVDLIRDIAGYRARQNTEMEAAKARR